MTIEAHLFLFSEEDGGPKLPVADGNRSLLFRFAGDERYFGATIETRASITAGTVGKVTLRFMVREAQGIARDGAFFEISLGARIVGMGCLVDGLDAAD
jgi:hypothetical protein